jgi:glycosyltransferase involved in cell wall biosynthesis
VRLAVIVEQVLAPVPGGTGRYAAEIAAALAAAAPAGSTVTGWTAWHRETGPARLGGVAGPRRLRLPRRGLVAAWERGLGPAPKADLVYAPTLLAPPRRGRPLVVTIHDAVPWTHPETLTARGVAWHRSRAEYAARHADRIVVPTRAVADELAPALPELASDRVVVIGEGATEALAEQPPDADARAARLALPSTGYLLSLATLEPRKALDVLLAGLTDPAAPDLPLVVVGQPGWGGIDPAAVAADLGLQPGRVRVFGRLTDPDLAVVLHRATALAVPSRAEGFGLPVLEAMAAGVPVVTSDAPALVEVGGGATEVVPTDDPAALAAALGRLAGDPERRKQLIEAGRRRATDYSWKASANALWSVLAALPSGGQILGGAR